MSLLSRRTMLKAGVAAVPAMALQSAPSVAQVCAIPHACGIATPSTLKQVATGCHIPDTEYAGVPAVLSRSPHFNRSGLRLHKLQIAVPNCIGGTAYPQTPKTWQAVIEYPLNTLTTVTWNGQEVVTGAITGPPGTQGPPAFVMSDEICLSVPIPDNALFWVRLSQTDATGAQKLLCQDIGNSALVAATSTPQQPSKMKRSINQALGEANCAAGPALLKNPVIKDPNYGFWTFTNGGVSYASYASDWASVRPMAILGQSRKPAFALWGDSRVCGIGDTFDGACDDRGEVERSVGPAYAYINFAMPGQPLADVSSLLSNPQFTSLAPHLVLGPYTTHLIEDFGGADCITYAHPPTGAPYTVADAVSTVMANKLILWNSWLQTGNPMSSLSTLTLPPHPDAGANANIKGVVDVLRTGKDANGNPLAIPARVLDIASIVATVNASSQYNWICPDYDADGVHESQAGCLAIAESGIIDPYALTR